MSEELLDEVAHRLETEGAVRGLDLSKLAFGGLDAEAPTFERCRASHAQFTGGELAESTWRDCELIACSFASVDFSGARFVNCRFADLENTKGSEFRFADLKGALFESCELSLARFNGCEAFDISFLRCMMRGAEFERTGFSRIFGRKLVKTQAAFEDCLLPFAAFAQATLDGCRLVNCDLTQANFTGAMLKEADLSGSNLMDAVLDKADLSGADLRGARLDGFDLGAPVAFQGMMISLDQQHHLLRSLGIEVCP
jgi:fluoroquinolone resistance protein